MARFAQADYAELMEKPRKLGRGLTALIEAKPSIDTDDGGLQQVRPAELEPNRFQPRRQFAPESILELAASLRVSGMMQPIIARPSGKNANARFEIIAGERRWRAALEAGLETVPVIVRPLSDQESAEWALVENLQREDLNPIDKAHALRALLEKFNLTQQQLASRLGIDRSSVANQIRLTELEPEISTLVVDNKLTTGHARALLAVPGGNGRIQLANECVRYSWTVRRLELEARTINTPVAPVAAPEEKLAERLAITRELEDKLVRLLGAPVEIRTGKDGKSGSISIRFFDLDHFDGLMAKLGVTGGRPAEKVDSYAS
ncbi:MAG: ParB/RepB/Spo0J family partition protein [Planctomycetota bacterium]|nr:ParB/RepB/Spo0J family partition protein [Planctomycetota bacterium]